MASGFVDRAKITIQSGNGGNGAVAFHREKYVAAGGPDGGDGGRGGNIIFTVKDTMTTLMDFRYKRKYRAENGADGSNKNCSGKDGKDLYIAVPRGTLIKDAATDTVMCDMSSGKDFIAARGGRGGWGNRHFASPTRQVPNFAKPGLPGETREVVLELKLLADVGLVGFPNAGKSTLLSVVSKAHPKIANYPFTTLFPNLGVVYLNEETSCVMADIPGLIEGASEGAGLGIDFLRHVERCRLLLHLVDVSGSEGRDPVEDFEAICREIERYSPRLAERPRIVVGTKSDLLLPGSQNAQKLQKAAEAKGYPFVLISAASHKGISALLSSISEIWPTLPPVARFEADYKPSEPEIGTSDEIDIQNRDGIWYLDGSWLQSLSRSVNFTDTESLRWFDRILESSGIYDRMRAMGIRDGDIVDIYGFTFEFKD
jgi:GTP-binding protein